jgi:hypothetical protein
MRAAYQQAELLTSLSISFPRRKILANVSAGGGCGKRGQSFRTTGGRKKSVKKVLDHGHSGVY